MRKAIYEKGVVTYVDDDAPVSTPENIEIEVTFLKENLTSTDYKVIKNVECMVLGLPLPYNAEELHRERQALRNKINELEKAL